MFSHVRISQHYMEEGVNEWLSWDISDLPKEPRASKDFLYFDKAEIQGLVEKGFASEACLPYEIQNFHSVALTLMYAKYLGSIDHVFFYGRDEAEIDLGSGIGIVKIIAEEDERKNEADYANVDAMFTYGLQLAQQGNHELAEHYWRKRINFHSLDDHARDYCLDSLGVLLANQRRMNEAIEIWIQGLKEYGYESTFPSRLSKVIEIETDEKLVSRVMSALVSD